MNVSEITAQLYAISKALVEKTGEKPFMDPALRIADGKCEIALFRGYNSGDYHIGTAKGDTPDDAIANAFAIIVALPDPAKAAIQRHMERVASCIDKGREDGIDDAYITPLVAVKTAMTENLLAKPATDEVAE